MLLDTTTKSHDSFVSHIDGLRAIAVISVVLYHLSPNLIPGGFAGVDVFFVISGYVISTSLAGRAHNSASEYAAKFYSRRMIRLLPALLVCLLITGLVMTVFVPHLWRGDTPRLLGTNQLTSLAAAFGVSNFLLIARGDNYFGDTADLNPFTHTWSLGVEEQFYFVFPLLFYFWVRKGATQGSRRLSVSLIAIAAAASFGTSLWASESNQSFSFYMIFTRFWELAIGALLYQWQTTRRKNNSDLVAGTLLAVSIGMLAAGFSYSNPQEFPYPWAVLPALGTAGMIAALHERPTDIAAKVLSSKPMRFFGRTSYSLYLWHWPVFVLFRWTIGTETMFNQFAALTASLLLMTASYNLIENPTRQSTWARTASPRKILIAGFATMLGTTALLSAIYLMGDRVSLSVTRDSATWYPLAEPFQTAQGDCRVTVTPYDFQSGKRVEFISQCDDNRSETRLFVLGDSHAGAYSTLFATAASQRPLHITVFKKGGCPIPDHLLRNTKSKPPCSRFTRASIKAVSSEAKPGDTLLITSFRMIELQRALRNPDRRVSPRSPDAEFAQAFANLLEPIVAKGASVLLEAPKPVVGKKLFRCSDWFNKNNPKCRRQSDVPRAMVEHYRRPVMQELNLVQSTQESIRVWDPLPILCEEEMCRGFREDNPLFIDENHVSGYGNIILMPSLLNEL